MGRPVGKRFTLRLTCPSWPLVLSRVPCVSGLVVCSDGGGLWTVLEDRPRHWDPSNVGGNENIL